MRRLHITYFLIMIMMVFMALSCSERNYVDYQLTLLSEVKNGFIDRYDTVVIIPRIGCNACTHDADIFFKQHKDDPRTYFVFTNLQSKKLLKIENGFDLDKRDNVFIDENNKHYSYDYDESNYPILLIKQPDNSYRQEYLLDDDILIQ